MAFLHKIKAKLYDNPLTPDPNDFTARVVSEKSLSLEDVCESAVKRGGADMKADAMARAYNLVFGEIAYRLSDGFSVNTGWIYMQPAIKGVFNSAKEAFTPGKHFATFEVAIGALLRKFIPSIEVEILGVADSSLQILEVHDVFGNSTNSLVTPGGILNVYGSKIKIDGESPACGAFFVNQATQERSKALSGRFSINNPGMLVFSVPELAAGEYKLEVATQFSGNSQKQLKEPRAAVFERILTVL